MKALRWLVPGHRTTYSAVVTLFFVLAVILTGSFWPGLWFIIPVGVGVTWLTFDTRCSK